MFLQVDNKIDVLQSLMLYIILVEKKAILDQFRKGLSIPGLLDEIQRKPEMFEECFVYQGILINDSVAGSLHFPASEDKNTQRVFQLLQTFIKKSIISRRKTVSCESINSIFASTCLMGLKLPNHFRNYAVWGGNAFGDRWKHIHNRMRRQRVMNSQKCTVCTIKPANVVVKNPEFKLLVWWVV